jgi:hypothetical protein
MGKNLQYFFLITLMALHGYADEIVASQSKSSFGADLYLSNNLGASTFFKNYRQDPYVATSFYAYPFFKQGPFWSDREFKIHAEASAFLEWVSQGNPFSGKFDKKFSMGDLKIRAELKKALTQKDLGLSLTPAFKLEAPLSKSSRLSNRLLGLGGYFAATWSKWGFFLTYKPVALGYIYSAPYKSQECGQDVVDDDRLISGKCKAAGRQTLVLVKNGFLAGYTKDPHSITLGFRLYHSFLRKANQGEKPELKPSSGLMEATLAYLEYSYSLPTTLPTSLILGISGYQNPYDAKNGFRLPFANFAEPEKNLTEAYVAINVTI